MHDRGVLARAHASSVDQVGVEVPREHLDNSHDCPPEGFLRRGEWFDLRHWLQSNLLLQAIVGRTLYFVLRREPSSSCRATVHKASAGCSTGEEPMWSKKRLRRLSSRTCRANLSFA